MKKLTAILTAGLVAGLVSASTAQPYPADGYVGVYGDAAGTQCCMTVAPFAMGTLHVIAKLNGQTAAGITGAEFRLEFSNAAGYFLTLTPNPLANLVLGNPTDDNPAANDQNKGVNLAFPTCQPDPIAAQLSLGTYNCFNTNPAGTGACTIRTKRHESPSNPTKRCPLFTKCDAPLFTVVPMTLTEDQLGAEPVAFVSQLNTTCDGTCGPVPVTPTTWSTLKDLYR
jgi:hypothetical protein